MSELEFVPLRRTDFALLRTWLGRPHGAEWWRVEPTAEYVEGEYGPIADGTDATRAFLIHYAGGPVGLIQSYRLADHPDWDRTIAVPNAVAIDYLIGAPEDCGRGIGTAVLAAFGDRALRDYPDVATVVAAPQQDNIASCRALEKAGYTLREARKLDSDDPSDPGISAIYVLNRSR